MGPIESDEASQTEFSQAGGEGMGSAIARRYRHTECGQPGNSKTDPWLTASKETGASLLRPRGIESSQQPACTRKQVLPQMLQLGMNPLPP